jgi:hypothetical protein
LIVGTKEINKKMEDHALEPVPESERQNWLSLSWNTAGIVTTLIQLFLGALVAFVAGIQIAILSGLFVVIVGFAMGWGVGHIGHKKGCSSTMISRTYGLGIKGSILASAIFGFMIIGFLAIENALLYKGFLFFFELPDTLGNQVLIYGLMTIAWILLTAFGFELVAKVSSVTLIAFLMVLLWMVVDIIARSGQSFAEALSFGTQLPPEAIAAMGIDSTAQKSSAKLGETATNKTAPRAATIVVSSTGARSPNGDRYRVHRYGPIPVPTAREAWRAPIVAAVVASRGATPAAWLRKTHAPPVIRPTGVFDSTARASTALSRAKRQA